MAQNCGTLCYCQEPLGKYEANAGEWTCCCCFKTQTIDTFYYCNAANCTYEKVTGSSYLACAACFESVDQEEDMDSKSEESSDAEAFLLKKVRWTLDRISYMPCALNRCAHREL